jgi:hypothetical protein
VFDEEGIGFGNRGSVMFVTKRYYGAIATDSLNAKILAVK